MFSLASQRWHRLPKMNVARTGHTLVVLEQVAVVGRLCLILYFLSLLQVVFAVGGGTDTAEWLDTDNGVMDFKQFNHSAPLVDSDQKLTNLKAFIRRGVGVVRKLTNAIMGGRRLSCYLLVFLVFSFVMT